MQEQRQGRRAIRAWVTGAMHATVVAMLAALFGAASPAEAVSSAPPASSGSGIPGKLAGALSVGSSGSAQYVIPIAVPPGTAAVVPQLSLRYDSSAGNGLMGLGWTLQGLSSITRCALTLVQDGQRAGVALTMADRYCLDNQRLVVTAGSYGAAGSEYRTEVESFTKVVASGSAGNGPASFKAWQRNGTLLEFGTTADARLTLPGTSTPVGWALNKVTDSRGNYYTVTYTFDSATGQQVPARIDYTGNAATTPSALLPYNSVQFVYDYARADVELHYIVGAKTTRTARLAKFRPMPAPRW